MISSIITPISQMRNRGVSWVKQIAQGHPDSKLGSWDWNLCLSGSKACTFYHSVLMTQIKAIMKIDTRFILSDQAIGLLFLFFLPSSHAVWGITCSCCWVTCGLGQGSGAGWGSWSLPWGSLPSSVKMNIWTKTPRTASLALIHSEFLSFPLLK